MMHRLSLSEWGSRKLVKRRMRTEVVLSSPVFLLCLANCQPVTDSQTAWENAVWLLQSPSYYKPVNSKFPESDANSLFPSVVRHQTAVRQSVSPGNLRLSIKWKNYFRLVKCSSLFFSVFLHLVVQVQDVCKDVCTCFLSCYFCAVFCPITV